MTNAEVFEIISLEDKNFINLTIKKSRMKYFISIQFILSSFTSLAQTGSTINTQEDNILRCEVKSTLFYVPLETGGHGWMNLPNMDEKMKNTITINFTKMKMYWDTHAKDNESGYDGGIKMYRMKNLIIDSSHTVFGFSSYKFNCSDEKNKISKYELIEYNLDECRLVYLIINEKETKIKYELKVL